MQLQSADTLADVRRLVASKVSEALARQPGLASTTVTNTAYIAAMVAAAIIALPFAHQKRLKGKSADVADMIVALASDDAPRKRIEIPEPARVESSKGVSFGELIDIEEGRRRLTACVIRVPLEEWAGPVAGSGTLTRDSGIARSSLYGWRKRGEVVALLMGARKHVFPLEQFVDGRPVQGIGDVLRIVGNPRRAWSWLVQQSPLLSGKRPIDLLKRDRRDEVVEAARVVFEYP